MFFDGGNRAYYEILATNFSQFFTVTKTLVQSFLHVHLLNSRT